MGCRRSGGDDFVHEPCLQGGEERALVIFFFTAFRNFRYITPAVTKKYTNNERGSK